MQKLFKRLLDLLNIHPDENQRWTKTPLAKSPFKEPNKVLLGNTTK